MLNEKEGSINLDFTVWFLKNPDVFISDLIITRKDFLQTMEDLKEVGHPELILPLLWTHRDESWADQAIEEFAKICILMVIPEMGISWIVDEIEEILSKKALENALVNHENELSKIE